jgi:hypothetical protein
MADLLTLETDAVAVPRAELQAVLEALASLVQASGQAFSLLIDRLDTADGDPDLEEDDPPGQCDEDEINTNLWMRTGEGPGCEISDPDKGADDDPERDEGEYGY